jgi:7-keto-8-aminopelargonate synthetase-like enzyme
MLFVWAPMMVSALAMLLVALDREVVTTVKKIMRNRKFLWEAYTIKKTATSLNHCFLLFNKINMGLPYTLAESPWDTYADVRNMLSGERMWTYMTKLDHTTQHELAAEMDMPTDASSTILNFSSYSYVDAIRDLDIREFVFKEMILGHYTFGNHGPRMLGGNSHWLEKLESRLAQFTGRERAICFSSGFLACKSAIQAVVSPRDIIFADSRCHESLRDGMRVARSRGAKVFFFKHNDLAHLSQLLRRHRTEGREAYVVVESVYSMDGDFCDLPAVKTIAYEHKCKVILDEAHGLGVVGKTGRGIEELQGCPGAAWIVVGSFTKALGSVGGYICCSESLYHFYNFFATGTMFSAPMSVPNAIMAWKVLDAIDLNPQWCRETRDNMDWLKLQLAPLEHKHQIVAQSCQGSPIVALILQDFNSRRVLTVAAAMKRAGFYVAAVNPPACEMRKPRLRITAPRGLTFDEISRFVNTLDGVLHDTAHLDEDNKMKELTDLLPLVGL